MMSRAHMLWVMAMVASASACTDAGGFEVAQPTWEKPIPSSEGASPIRGRWYTRFTRPCKEWEPAALRAVVSDTRVYGCDGAVFALDSGQVVQASGDDEVAAAWQGRTVTTDGVTMALKEGTDVVRSNHLMDTRVLDATFSPDGAWLMYRGRFTDAFPRILDFQGGSWHGHEGFSTCKDARFRGFSSRSTVQCVVEQEGGVWLRTLDAEDVSLDVQAVHGAYWDPHGGHVVVAHDDLLSMFSESGTVVARRPLAKGEEVIALGLAHDLLVATAHGTERWWVKGAGFQSELVYPDRLFTASLGHDVVVWQDDRNLVWLTRGESPREPTLAPPEAPPGFHRLVRHGDEWRDPSGHAFRTRPDDVATFGDDATFIRVAHGDMDELAGRDLGDWGAAAVGRYLEPGDDRWAKVWIDEAGHRHLRSHTFIGGCVRTHIDIHFQQRVDDQGLGVLERWFAYSGTGQAELFGPVPGDAASVTLERDAPIGFDPSIGRVEQAHRGPLRFDYQFPARRFHLDGEPLLAARTIPLWFDLHTCDREHDGKCSLDVRAFAAPVDHHWVYLHQEEIRYTGQHACRLLHVDSGELSVPQGGCMRPRSGHLSRLVGTGAHGWFLIAEASEGPVTYTIGHYTADDGFRARVSLPAFGHRLDEPDFRYETAPEGLHLWSRCPLPKGCDGPPPDGAPLRRFRWTPDEGVVLTRTAR